MANERWSKDDLHRLHQMKKTGVTFRRMAVVLGRSLAQVRNRIAWEARKASRFQSSGRYVSGNGRIVATLSRPSNEMIAAAEHLRGAYDLRDLTASFCGDPPPGYSALDQKRNAGA